MNCYIAWLNFVKDSVGAQNLQTSVLCKNEEKDNLQCFSQSLVLKIKNLEYMGKSDMVLPYIH